jgi:hypothetical protein
MKFTDPDETPQQEQERSTVYLNPPDMIHHLLLIWPVRYETDTFTKYPRKNDAGVTIPSDAVYSDIVDLSVVDPTTSQPGYLMRNCKWTQGRLIRDTKKFVGTPDPLLMQMSKDGDAYQLIPQQKNPGSVLMAEQWESRNPGFRPSVPGEQEAPQATATPVTAQSPEASAMDRLRRQAGNTPPLAPQPLTLASVMGQEEEPPF